MKVKPPGLDPDARVTEGRDDVGLPSDAFAYQRLFQRCNAYLDRFLASKGLSGVAQQWADREDWFHAAICKATRTYDPERGRLDSWIAFLFVNAAVSAYRQRRVLVPLSGIDSADDGSTPLTRELEDPVDVQGGLIARERDLQCQRLLNEVRSRLSPGLAKYYPAWREYLSGGRSHRELALRWGFDDEQQMRNAFSKIRKVAQSLAYSLMGMHDYAD